MLLPATAPETISPPRKRPFYMGLSFQVLLGVAIAIISVMSSPASAVAMKPLGDAFIRLITMIITLVIFCTLVTGIAGMEDMKKVGRVGGKALLYFEAVSTLALLIGLVVGHVVRPGSGFKHRSCHAGRQGRGRICGQAKAQSVYGVPRPHHSEHGCRLRSRGETFTSAARQSSVRLRFVARRPALQTARRSLGRPDPRRLGVVAILMRFAPIGAFGAMAFTIGKYGLASLSPLLKLMVTLYITSILFVILVLGGIARRSRLRNPALLWYLREEILLVLATSSSEPALPSLMAKLEKLGCSKALVGLVVPTGYTFNADGTSLYMTLAALFVAQATNTHLTLAQQFTLLGVAVLTSKGASGVQGAAFIALVATMMVIPTIPVAGMGLILGIDRFLSMCRAAVNMTGNAVAALVVARWENELDRNTLRKNLAAEESGGR